MELNYSNLKIRPRLLKAATGLGPKEFTLLIGSFAQAWEARNGKYTLEGKVRQRGAGPRKNNTFKCTEDLMLFILHHYKANPTQEMMGLIFNLPQPKVWLWIKALEPILLQSLKKLNLVPVRDSVSLHHGLIDSVTVILDGSERPIRRPKYEQKEFFSGKKRDIRSKTTW